ncbi:MAG: radical SAM protein [Bacillota bacterium]
MINRTKLGESKKRFEQWGWRQAKKIRTQIHELNYFFWEATLKCNLNCRHCGSDCTKDEKLPELPAEKVLEVFSDIAQNYKPQDIMVAVTGGEPLVRKDLFDILDDVNQLGFPWGMVTNGMLVDEKVVGKCITAGMKTVSVSLDGNAHTHNWLRKNENSYKKAINALKLFVEAEKFDTVEAITCVYPGNIDHLNELYETIQAIGIQSWRLFTIFPKGRALDDKALLMTPNLLMKLFSFIKEKRQQSDCVHINYCEEGYLGRTWEKEVRDDFFYCGAGINIAGLLCDGTYSACPSLSKNWAQGHIDALSFSEAWETKYANMRNRDWMKGGSCTKCKEWKNCQGSSLHLWDWELGRPKMCHYHLLDSIKEETNVFY